jgi:hypothetical protein
MYAVHADFTSDQQAEGFAAIRAIVLVAFSGLVLWSLMWRLASLLWVLR